MKLHSEIEESINILYDQITCLKLEINTGGMRREVKRKAWENLCKDVVLNIIEAKNLDYSIKVGIPIIIAEDFTKKVDISIFDANNNIIYCIEVKDYADTTMYGGICGNNACLSYRYPNCKFIIVTAQIAAPASTMVAIKNAYHIIDKTYDLCILGNKRISKNDISYLSDLEDGILLGKIETFENSLSEIIV